MGRGNGYMQLSCQSMYATIVPQENTYFVISEMTCRYFLD